MWKNFSKYFLPKFMEACVLFNLVFAIPIKLVANQTFNNFEISTEAGVEQQHELIIQTTDSDSSSPDDRITTADSIVLSTGMLARNQMINRAGENTTFSSLPDYEIVSASTKSSDNISNSGFIFTLRPFLPTKSSVTKDTKESTQVYAMSTITSIAPGSNNEISTPQINLYTEPQSITKDISDSNRSPEKDAFITTHLRYSTPVILSFNGTKKDIKVIDKEKIESIQEKKYQNISKSSTTTKDNIKINLTMGHDGVKITRKKQLLDMSYKHNSITQLSDHQETTDYKTRTTTKIYGSNNGNQNKTLGQLAKEYENQYSSTVGDSSEKIFRSTFLPPLANTEFENFSKEVDSTMETLKYTETIFHSTQMPNEKEITNNNTDILILEITGTDNITNIKSDGDSDFSIQSEVNSEGDELFIPDLKIEPFKEDAIAIVNEPSGSDFFSSDFVDRDSDTIFYISNTEVKVVESLPTIKTGLINSKKRYEIKETLFPAIYEEDVIIDLQPQNQTNKDNFNIYSDRYKEDIILSPLKNNFKPANIIKKPINISNDGMMSSRYVKESFIDAEQSTNLSFQMKKTNFQHKSKFHKSLPISVKPLYSTVLIQPAAMPPDISIGIPVIGELPPQIELKKIGFISNDQEFSHSLSKPGKKTVSEINIVNNRIGNSKSGDDDPAIVIDSQIDMHAGDNMQMEELIAEMPAVNESKIDDIQNGTHLEGSGNSTTYSTFEESDGELNFGDIHTLLLACFATLTPLILSVILACGLRFLWKKFREADTGNGMIGDCSTDPLAARSINLSQEELKSTNSVKMANHGNEIIQSYPETVGKFEVPRNEDISCVGDSVTANHNGHVGLHVDNHFHEANGSIITMTLKNNHLIVETEERNDMSRDARETKMHYTSSEKDGVFVVEVSRGADSTGVPPSPQKLKVSADIKNNISENQNFQDRNNISNHEAVQIHQPPSNTDNNEDSLIQIDEKYNPLKSDTCVNFRSSNTGLSQSDLSSSSTDSNKGYSYGNQQLYTGEEKTTSVIIPKLNGLILTKSEEIIAETKPIIIDALLKQPPINGNNPENMLKSNKQNGNVCISNLENGQSRTDSENGYDSFISLPEPPSTEEIKQLNDVILTDSNQLDSLPPPPPPLEANGQIFTTLIETIEEQNGRHEFPLTGSS